jgi:hypothetical protein
MILLLIVTGDRDCMDWSDEYLFGYGEHCPITPNTMKCDEHLCDGGGIRVVMENVFCG